MLTTLQQDLERWGPESGNQHRLGLAESRQYTRRVALGHYENFPVVTWMLPAHLRQPFYDIYAFCRWSDDLGDEIESSEESLRLLSWWRQGLIECVQGQAFHPVYIALADTISRYQLSLQNFHDLITAFEKDQTQNRFETYAQLLDYCCYSANPVGRILLELTNCHNEQTQQLSDSVCTGLQLINFWQDVARDWSINRVYLPGEDLQQFGVTIEQISRGQCTPEFRQLLQHEVRRAEDLLQQGKLLGRLVSREIRFDIRLFALGGLKLCEKIRQQNYDVLSQRPRLRKWDLPGLFWRACWF